MAEKPHYGPEEPDVLALSHELGSEWVSKQMKAMEHASDASSVEQKNELAVRAN